MQFDTLCVHGHAHQNDATGSISVPIYQNATFAHPGVGKSTGYDYSRIQNPTREHLEKTIACLEHGTDALAFSTGMAAITAILDLFSPGDTILIGEDLYGGSIRLFNSLGVQRGLHFTSIDTLLPLSQTLITPQTKALFIETPTNPMMDVTDLRKASAFAKAHQLLLIVDNTFLTPYFQNPLDLGADIVIHSGTKYLAGHNDTLAGFTIVKDPTLAERLRFIYGNTGACLSPFDSWLLIRSLKTLGLRMDKAQANALELAQWLEKHPKVTKVCYTGLPSHPAYTLSCTQSRGFGAMISFSTASPATAIALLEGLNLIYYAESLGGVESLITYPMLQTHADVPLADREARGINDCLLRLSVGIENINDLIADLDQAFKGDSHD